MPSVRRARLWVASSVNEQVGTREAGALLLFTTRAAGTGPAAPGPGSLPSSS